MLDNPQNKTIVLKGDVFRFDVPMVMAIINITPDSFFEGSRATFADDILKKIETAVWQGAKIVDIGAYSTRPNADFVSEEEEYSRLSNALNIIRKNYSFLPISVDTFRSEIAKKVVKEFEVDIINDISGGTLDENMFKTIAELNVPYILMHTRGTPQTMANLTEYENIVADILKYFSQKIELLRNMGFVSDIIIDLGFGFAKTIEQNYKLLANQKVFECFNLPILTGISRKSMIYKAIDITPTDALNGTTVLNALSLLNGADILRVHDVKEAMETIKLIEFYKKFQ